MAARRLQGQITVVVKKLYIQDKGKQQGKYISNVKYQIIKYEKKINPMAVLSIPTTDSLYGLFSAGLRLLQASQYDKGRLSYWRACKNLRPAAKRPSRLSVLGMVSTSPFSIAWCLL